MIGYLASLFLIFGLTASLAATPDFDLGPPTGTKAPTIGTPLDETGKPRSLESLMGDNGLVLFFFRSAAWCPYCQAQLIDLNSGVADIESPIDQYVETQARAGAKFQRSDATSGAIAHFV